MYIKEKGKTFLRWYICLGCASDLHTSAKAVCLNVTDLEQMLVIIVGSQICQLRSFLGW